MLYKTLVAGVIILFIGVTIAPSINAFVDKSSIKTFTNPIFDEIVEITVSRYKADSTVEKNKVLLSKEKALEFNERYKNTDEPEKRFSLLKEYGIIPDDVTRDSLREEMVNLAEELGFTEDKIETISERYGNNEDNRRVIGINFLNEIVGLAFFTINLPIGLSLIIGILNLWLSLPGIQSADLLYFAFSIFGMFTFWNGILPDFVLGYLGFFSLVGFIGYIYSTPFLAVVPGMVGFTVASLAFPVRTGYR